MQRLSVSLRGVRHCLNPQDLFKAVEASMEKSSRLSDVQNLELLVRGAIWSPKKVFWSLSKSLLRIQWRLWWKSTRSGIWRRRLTATTKGDDCQRRQRAKTDGDDCQRQMPATNTRGWVVQREGCSVVCGCAVSATELFASHRLPPLGCCQGRRKGAAKSKLGIASTSLQV